MSTGELRVQLQNPAGARLPAAAAFRQWVQAALGVSKGGELTIRVVDEAESASLNEQFRGKPGPTNVLSFAADAGLSALTALAPIGDLVICAGVVEREAREQNKTAEAHWAHLTVHGVLHLAGFDHETEDEAAVMEDRECRILESLGFADPYQ